VPEGAVILCKLRWQHCLTFGMGELLPCLHLHVSLPHTTSLCVAPPPSPNTPPPLQIQSTLERVRAGADVMPRTQLEGQLVAELGPDWATRLAAFDWTPRAAASIGQVHAAHLPDGTQVAMKIQYPGMCAFLADVGGVQTRV
jgi:hypothetical protein